jgi:hypothetical protein
MWSRYNTTKPVTNDISTPVINNFSTPNASTDLLTVQNSKGKSTLNPNANSVSNYLLHMGIYI